jgi:hypothetical protein
MKQQTRQFDFTLLEAAMAWLLAAMSKVFRETGNWSVTLPISSHSSQKRA